MITVGIDVGSLAAKAVVFDGAIRGTAVQPTGWEPRRAGEEVFRAALAAASCRREDVAYTVGTGYGRVCLPFIQEAVTEITCHARGAHYMMPATRTVIDVGGQDSKVIRLDADGNVEDFAMNDKCAAGTGRFCEVMAGVLGMDVITMATAALDSEPVSISSMCTVFAESEVIGLLAAGVSKGRIVAGLFRAIAARLATMAAKIPLEEGVTFTGGVAKNAGVKQALEAALGRKLLLPPEPQIIGALGAALIAWDRVRGAKKD